ncbi:MAG: hypothetical protein ACK5JT_15865 [Hyphomicrobiaceae bacterium]
MKHFIFIAIALAVAGFVYANPDIVTPTTLGEKLSLIAVFPAAYFLGVLLLTD